MSSKILFILLIVGLISVKVTNAQTESELLKAIGALFAAIAEIVQDEVLAALAKVVSAIINNPNDTSAINSAMTELEQAVEKRANCGILKDGQQYYIQSVGGSMKERYVQSSTETVDIKRRATMTKERSSASKFTVVQKSCNVYGLCVRGMCMSRCENGCDTGTKEYQTVVLHVTDTTGSYSQWTVSASGDAVGGPYNLKSDIGHYLDYVRLSTGTGVVSLNATLLPESQFKFVEVEPCTGMLVNGQEYYLKTNTGDYVVVKGDLAYFEQIEQASATKVRAVKWDCNVFGFCITGTNGDPDKCMSRCQGCVSDTMDFQSVQFHVSDSFRPFSQWNIYNNTDNGLLELYPDGFEFGKIFFNTTPSGAKQLVLDLNSGFGFEFIKAT